MTNIAELLNDCPTGTKLYSPLFGECKLGHIEDEVFIHVSTNYTDDFEFDEFGQVASLPIGDNANGECLLFPSKDCRTWEGWKLPKPHYNISNFKPFDKVLVRDRNDEPWRIAFYGYYNEEAHYSHFVGTYWSKQCIPFEGNEHLLGTTDMPSEEFINW